MNRDIAGSYDRLAGEHVQRLYVELVAFPLNTCEVQADEGWNFAVKKGAHHDRFSLTDDHRGDYWGPCGLGPGTSPGCQRSARSADD